MIDLGNIEGRFNECKEVLLEVLISYYGEEYAEIITERFNSIVFDLTSPPNEDYNYMTNHESEIDDETKAKVTASYKMYDMHQDDYIDKNITEIIEYLKTKFIIKGFDKEQFKAFFLAFSSLKFTPSLIDSFTSESIALLNNPNVAQSIKDSILNDQKKLISILKSLNIQVIQKGNGLDTIETVLRSMADGFVRNRESLLKKYKIKMMYFTEYGSNFVEKYCKAINYEGELGQEDYVDLADIAIYSPGGTSLAGRKIGTVDEVCYFLKAPLVQDINRGTTSLDILIIHEIIHLIESTLKNIGTYDRENGRIFNEIRTQKNAVDICKMLHERGVYMYDDPKKCVIEDTTLYEKLNPLVDEFLDKYGKVLNDCGIMGTPEKLTEIFGPFWIMFNREIDIIFKEHMSYCNKARKSLPLSKEYDSVKVYIANMENIAKGSGLSV